MNTTWSIGTLTSTTERRAATQRKYRQSEKGKRASRAHTVKQTDKAYLSRPFIAWDGEGVTLASGQHLYTSLQSSSGVSIHDRLGLRSHVIFDALCNERANLQPDAIHVIYGGGYDFNMWLSDVPKESVERLYKQGHCYYGHFKLSWRPSKYFRITRRTDKVTVQVNDVVSFFQRTFVAACDEYLGERFYKRELIVKNKALRGTFTHSDQAEVDEYNNAELINLVRLMTELRARLDAVGLRPARWDGPGAIAVALMRREGVKSAMKLCPPKIAEAGRYAYAGGRFEVFQHGYHENVNEYDINSAYPTALQHVPDLTNGYWRKSAKPTSEYDFAVYRVQYVAKPDNFKRPQPLWTRSPKGNIYYGYNVENWYWAPEVIAAQEYVAKHGGTLRIVDGYKFHPRKDAIKPFAFIAPMYAERRRLKKAGDGAHVGIKLGLNSLYGKTAQRVGAFLDPKTGVWRTPPFHQLEWAGYVTSFCRGRLLRAVLNRLDDVIAMETDAMFVRGEPVEGIELGSDLGEWERTEFERLAYGQSGFYTGRLREDSSVIVRTRGIDRPATEEARDLFAAELEETIIRGGILPSSISRFIGVGLALQLNNWNLWRRWETSDKNVNMEPTGKRVHVPERCDRCSGDSLHHQTEVPMPIWDRAYSSAYPVPWINPDEEMTDLDELSKFNLENMGMEYE